MLATSRQVRFVLALSLIWSAFPSQAKASALPKPIVFVSAAKLKELSELLTYPARVEPRIKAAVASEADGRGYKNFGPAWSAGQSQHPTFSDS